MNRKKAVRKRIIAVFISALFLILAVPTGVYAVGDEMGSITIQLEDLGTQRNGVSFQVYQVAVLSEDGNSYWRLDPRILMDQVNINEIKTAQESQTAALELAKVIAASGINSQKVTTNQSGEATAEKLELGLYLIIQDHTSDYGTVAPFLADIPQKTDEGWSYHALVYPKGEELKPSNIIPPNPTKSSPEIKGARTGDTNNLEISLFLLLASGLMLLIFLNQKRRDKDGEKI